MTRGSTYHGDGLTCPYDVHRQTDKEGGVEETESRDNRGHGPVDDDREVGPGILHVARYEANLKELVRNL